MSGSGSVGAGLTPQQLDELRAIDSPTIANAIEEFKVRPRVNGYAGATLRCLIPGLGTMLGYAVTCKGDSTTEGKQRREHTELYRAINALQPLPAVVVIGDDGDPGRIDLSCHAGEMMATTMKRVGAVGLVTDGGLRDIKEVTDLGGLPLLRAGPGGGPRATLHLRRRGHRDHLRHGGAPGDLLHGDENGITVVPAQIAAEVVAKALEVREHEQGRLKEILGPDFHRQFEIGHPLPVARYQ